ncbi:hypothetical protein ACHHYP_17267 [Achlya hypogyna]|uniref:Uncharacterized protein n=1 Tax=Achlya hypogyna TaxID=1202772 RepID=A0A1V9Y4U3_ACHHY|nr:hypothetical protein ACHHYP_17267 [Achlya hypogyna]
MTPSIVQARPLAGAFAHLVVRFASSTTPAAKDHLVLLFSSHLVLYARHPLSTKAPCTCITTSLPCPHFASMAEFALLTQLPLSAISKIYLPYQTHGSAVATRRSDLVLQTVADGALWLDFSYNIARSTFLDALVQALSPTAVSVDSLDLDDIDARRLAAQPPNAHGNADDDDLSCRQSPAYEAQIVSLYMQLDAHPPASSGAGSALSFGLRLALAQLVKHALELDDDAAPLAATLLQTALECAVHVDLVDVHVAAVVVHAAIDTKHGRLPQAHAHLQTALRMSVEIEHRVLLFAAYLGLCDLEVAQRRLDKATEMLHRAREFAPPEWKLSYHGHLQTLQALPSPPLNEKIDAWWGLSQRPVTRFAWTVLESLPLPRLLLELPQHTTLVKVETLVHYRIGYDANWTVADLLAAAIRRHERGRVSSRCIVGLVDVKDRVIPLLTPLHAALRRHPDGFEALLEPRSMLHSAGSAPHEAPSVSCSLCNQAIALDNVESHSEVCFQSR